MSWFINASNEAWPRRQGVYEGVKTA